MTVSLGGGGIARVFHGKLRYPPLMQAKRTRVKRLHTNCGQQRRQSANPFLPYFTALITGSNTKQNRSSTDCHTSALSQSIYHYHCIGTIHNTGAFYSLHRSNPVWHTLHQYDAKTHCNKRIHIEKRQYESCNNKQTKQSKTRMKGDLWFVLID